MVFGRGGAGYNPEQYGTGGSSAAEQNGQRGENLQMEDAQNTTTKRSLDPDHLRNLLKRSEAKLVDERIEVAKLPQPADLSLLKEISGPEIDLESLADSKNLAALFEHPQCVFDIDGSLELLEECYAAAGDADLFPSKIQKMNIGYLPVLSHLENFAKTANQRFHVVLLLRMLIRITLRGNKMLFPGQDADSKREQMVVIVGRMLGGKSSLKRKLIDRILKKPCAKSGLEQFFFDAKTTDADIDEETKKLAQRIIYDLEEVSLVFAAKPKKNQKSSEELMTIFEADTIGNSASSKARRMENHFTGGFTRTADFSLLQSYRFFKSGSARRVIPLDQGDGCGILTKDKSVLSQMKATAEPYLAREEELSMWHIKTANLRMVDDHETTAAHAKKKERQTESETQGMTTPTRATSGQLRENIAIRQPGESQMMVQPKMGSLSLLQQQVAPSVGAASSLRQQGPQKFGGLPGKRRRGSQFTDQKKVSHVAVSKAGGPMSGAYGSQKASGVVPLGKQSSSSNTLFSAMMKHGSGITSAVSTGAGNSTPARGLGGSSSFANPAGPGVGTAALAAGSGDSSSATLPAGPGKGVALSSSTMMKQGPGSASVVASRPGGGAALQNHD